jgi:hypothetical protein
MARSSPLTPPVWWHMFGILMLGSLHFFPSFADGQAAGGLRLRPNEFTNWEVSLADGYRPELCTALALYSGHMVVDWPMGEYVLALPFFRLCSHTWHPSVDAAVRCLTRQPPLCTAALFNQSCHDTMWRRYPYRNFPGENQKLSRVGKPTGP